MCETREKCVPIDEFSLFLSVPLFRLLSVCLWFTGHLWHSTEFHSPSATTQHRIATEAFHEESDSDLLCGSWFVCKCRYQPIRQTRTQKTPQTKQANETNNAWIHRNEIQTFDVSLLSGCQPVVEPYTKIRSELCMCEQDFSVNVQGPSIFFFHSGALSSSLWILISIWLHIPNIS